MYIQKYIMFRIRHVMTFTSGFECSYTVPANAYTEITLKDANNYFGSIYTTNGVVSMSLVIHVQNLSHDIVSISFVTFKNSSLTGL